MSLNGFSQVTKAGPLISSSPDELRNEKKMITNYLEEFLTFFSNDAASLITPADYLGLYVLSMMPVIIGTIASLAGNGLIANGEERGLQGMIISHPVGCWSVIFGRSLGILGTALSIYLLGWLGFGLLLGNSSLGIRWDQMTIPFLSLLVQTLVYTSMALLLSMVLPSRNMAAMVNGVIIIASCFISSMAFLDVRLQAAAGFTPYQNFQTVLSLDELEMIWLCILLGICLVITFASPLRISHRNIALSFDGNRRLPFLPKHKKIAQAEE
jgi:ABC-type transport system involved in multi-copper enzyme maturation permease subunit